ncbi:MAG: hypothetical protein AB7G93_22470 [Bdellovibrionales bacterium]
MTFAGEGWHSPSGTGADVVIKSSLLLRWCEQSQTGAATFDEEVDACIAVKILATEVFDNDVESVPRIGGELVIEINSFGQ